MKKLFLTVSIALMCMTANAGFVKTYPTINNIATIQTEQVTDSISEKTEIGTLTTVQQLSKVAFYDINRLVISNDSCKYIRIEDAKGNVIIETHEAIDIDLVGGNYYVYTTAPRLTASYK